MKNRFDEEVVRAINQGGAQGRLYMVKQYVDYSIVEDEGMSPEEKLKYGLEMLDNEVKHYEKKEKRYRIKTKVMAIIALIMMIGLFITGIVTRELWNDDAFLWFLLTMMIWVCLLLSLFDSDFSGEDRLVLFWLVYLDKLLENVDFGSEEEKLITRKMKRAYRVIA